ncbi:MAG: HAMP domain-containing sensor histidine kinase [Bacteroidales bacterium]|nr:HAMP domain-containing sensor histidine kinase [Bacteroidales bacterium]HOI31239.1 HAMP domain-containing sensor histidine kinase [Bacteroidales bacterium]
MNLYAQKKRWKIVLAIIALVIIGASIYYTNVLVNRFAVQERTQIRVWADAVQRRASLMNITEAFFDEVREQERKRIELLAQAYRRLLIAAPNENLNFYLEIISNNTSIPVLITNENNHIEWSANLPPHQQHIDSLSPDLLAEYTVYEPIEIILSGNKKQMLYYKESRIFTEMKNVLDDLVSSFFNEVALNAVSVPVIITDSTQKKVIQYGNLDGFDMHDSSFVKQQLDDMSAENKPISIDLENIGRTYIFYRSSDLLLQMQFFPLFQILIITLFLLMAYLLFSYARRSEQNQVWAGMAKETAHQIGTPLSSLMAWIELLKMQPEKIEGVEEMEKDVQRLETITERFSRIGSAPVLEPSNITKVIEETIDYLKKRSSRKIIYTLQLPAESVIIPLNASLFRWVIENLCKNAIDAMSGHGTITIRMKTDERYLLLDVKDTGKGMHKSVFSAVFNPGYTSKKRGWGLGLSLAKRIIKDYHKGKIFVKTSTINEGTTFRIMLRLK